MKISEVIERIKTYSVGETRFDRTCDVVICGETDREVTGIVTTFMATVEVIQKARALGANFIITHEPTWFTGMDTADWCAEDSVYQAKKKLLDESGITIWRYHDYMHAAKGDMIYQGMMDKLGWQNYLTPDQRAPWVYDIPATTVRGLAEELKQKLDMTAIQLIGDPELPVHRVIMLVGGGSLGLGTEQMPMQAMEQYDAQVMLTGDITEWTTCAYIRDAAQMGMPRAMLKMGHNRSEEGGMEFMPQWLPALIDNAAWVKFVEAGEPFTYL